MLKKCSKCGFEKDIDLFYRLSSASDGHRPECKECTPKGRDQLKVRLHEMAKGILRRTNNSEGKNKAYRGIKCLIGTTHREIFDYLRDNFAKEIEGMISKGFVPTVDRIDSSKHYEPDNIRILPLEDNVLLGAMKGAEVTSKPVIAVYPNGRKVKFKSIKYASEELGISRHTIKAGVKSGTPLTGNRTKVENQGIIFIEELDSR